MNTEGHVRERNFGPKLSFYGDLFSPRGRRKVGPFKLGMQGSVIRGQGAGDIIAKCSGNPHISG